MNFIKGILGFIQNYFKSLIFLVLMYLIFAPSGDEDFRRPNLMKINLSGPIMSDGEFLKNIDKAMKPNIQGVLLVVDSPGGAVAPSIEMSMAIKRLKESKPVVAYAKGIMASGSYYAAINANKIIANPGATIGSIGVIFNSPNFEELAKNIGIKEQIVSAGKYKQIGTPTRTWKPHERAELQKIIDNTYTMFITDVANARGLDINKSSEFADAHVFTAMGAKKVGLIDELGSLYSAKKSLINLSKVTTPIWMKEDKFDKIIDKIISKASFSLYSYFYGLKAI